MIEGIEIIVLGPPLSGKSVQSRKIASKLQLEHVSTGQIFRDAIAQQSQIGLQVKEIVESGRLVPDELVIDILRTWLDDEKHQHGFVLDGFPRTTTQALFLNEYFDLRGKIVDAIIVLKVSQEEIFRRAAKRRLEEKRVDDESDASLLMRLGLYQNNSIPAIQNLESRGIVHYVDGHDSIQEVFKKIWQIIEKLDLPTTS